MPRLYLIRRNLESFVGPVTIDGMREAYKRMAFGLQDEVSGHAGDWVALDDIDRLRRKYPDVAKVVSQDMLGGWGVGENTGLRMMNDDTSQVFVNNRGRSLKMALAFLAVAIMTFAAAMYLSNKGKFSGKLKLTQEIPNVEDIADKVRSNQISQVMAEIDAHESEIVSQSTKSKAMFVDWIPYLRLYAFEKNGMVPGVRPKLLKGAGAASAPTDCSINVWRRRWKNSVKKWPSLLQSKKLVRSHWARILAWDPHWIARRSTRGWVQPKNFYVGCITMARKALHDITTDSSVLPGANVVDWQKYGHKEISYRLDWLHRVSLGGVLQRPDAPDNQLARWSCFESARDISELTICTEGFKPGPNFAAYDDERLAWNIVRIAAKEKGQMSQPVMAALQSQQSKLKRTDHFTRFDYRPELKFIKALIKQGGNPDSIVSRLTNDFPEVNLAH